MAIGVAATAGVVSLAAAVFVGLIVAASIMVSTASVEWIRPVRMVGPGVRTWGGYVLIVVGGWFLLLSTFSTPVLL